MEPCPGCDRSVTAVHPLPPDVITRDVVRALAGPDSAADLRACVGCLDELRRTGSLAEVPGGR